MSGFTSEMPTKVGMYENVSSESDGVIQTVAVTKADDGQLQVHDRDLGIQLLNHYHNGLTHLVWRHIA